MKATMFRKMVKNRRFFWMSDWFSLVISAPVRTSVSDGLAEARLDAAGELLVADRAVAADLDGVDEAGLGRRTPARSGRSNSEKVAPPGESASPKRGDAGQGELPGAGGRRDLDLVADREVALVGAALVDGHLVATARPLPLDEGPRRELAAERDRAERGWAVCPETSGLPSLPMMLAKPWTSPCASDTPGTALTSSDDRVRHPVALLVAEVGLDHVGRADVGVGVAERVGEERS